MSSCRLYQLCFGEHLVTTVFMGNEYHVIGAFVDVMTSFDILSTKFVINVCVHI